MSEHGIEASIGVQLTAAVDTLSEEMAASRRRQDELSQQVRPFTVMGIPVILSGGDGTLNMPNLLGPGTSHYWDVRRISCWGFTAGTVNVTLGSAEGDLLVPFTTAGVATFGSAQQMLRPGDFVVVTASGITGSVTFAMAGIQVAAPLIGAHLL